MKKQLLLLAMILLPLVASAHDIEVQNADGVTIYYNYINDVTELEVTFRGISYDSYSNEYQGNVAIPEEVTYMNRTRKVTSIGSNAFRQCSGLTSVTIGNSVTSIGEGAFRYCSGLTSVTIPNSVTSIGQSAFNGCSGLTSVTIPNSVTSIGGSAFYECSGLTSVTIGNSVTSIGVAAFFNCSELTSVTIPNSVTSIGEYAFFDCDGLTSITIPNSVTSIGGAAFSNCSGLTSITIPNSVTSIGGSAFSSCSGLTSITIPNSVTSIGQSAFYGCSKLTTVTIGSGVTSIGGYAFDCCSDLKKVIVKDIAAWCGIKFDGYYSNPLYYAKHIFSDEDTEITDLIIPNSVTSIGGYAFSKCSGLTFVTIPNSVTSIGRDAFFNCSELTSVTIGNSVTSIGADAFYNCSGLTSITIPNSVTSIGGSAFEGCKALTSVTIPNSVTSIGENAFSYCSSLTSVVSLNPQPPTCYTNTFSDYSIPLYVPQGCSPQYMEAEVWRNFGTIRELKDIYLTINDGAKGNIEIKVDKENPYMTLRVQPEIGWHIYSVSFNGETVTGEIDSDGTYTTPTINQNSELNIVYAQGASSAPSLENPHIHFSSTENSIVINGTMGGESISVCSLEGKCLAKVVASGYTTEIPLYTHQTYLIKINQSVFKVSM